MIILNENCFVGSYLARYFGLNSKYFTNRNAVNKKTLHHSIKIITAHELQTIFVEVPCEITNLIKNNYICTVVQPVDDLREYEYIFDLTKTTKLGFWK